MRVQSLLFAALLGLHPATAHSIGSQKQTPLSSSDSLSSLLALHKSLIEYSSITNNESAVAGFLVTYLESQNLTVERQLVAKESTTHPARHNILAYSGISRRTTILVSSHIDTVPPFWPYERRGDEIWGRGSVDAKGSVATQIAAYLSLVSDGTLQSGDAALLFVVGEEAGGSGMIAANSLGLSWSSVIFGEPTELKLASGHKGTLGFTLTAHGKAGHSGYPELGRSANAMLVRALYALENVQLPWSEKFGNTTLNIGKIEGGVAANVIAEDAKASVMLRIAAGDLADVKELILDTVHEALGDDAAFVDVEFSTGYGPVPIDHDVAGELSDSLGSVAILMFDRIQGHCSKLWYRYS
jgi:acetylornithine deacetylase